MCPPLFLFARVSLRVMLVKLLAIFHVSTHTKIFSGDVFLLFRRLEPIYKCFTFCRTEGGGDVIYKYREALFHGPLLPGPETRGLSLMHRDNIGGRIQGKLLSCTQKRQIEKFIFNGASLARPPACLLWSYENIRCLQQNYKHLFSTAVHVRTFIIEMFYNAI